MSAPLLRLTRIVQEYGSGETAVTALAEELRALVAERDELEAAWLEAAEVAG